MDKQQNDIDTLVALWLTDDLPENKKQEFDLWMKSHPEVATEVTQLKAISKLVGTIEKPTGDSFESRWQKIADKTVSKQRPLLPRVYKIAASLAACVVLATWATLWLRNGNVVVYTKNASLKTILLPDSSQVTLNSASSLHYNKNLWFLSREIDLEGEAFFDVRKNGTSFVVHTSLANTKVLGTSFNIKQRGNTVSVSCLTGIVRVTGSKDNVSTLLEKGNVCTVQDETLTKTTFDITDGSVIAWRNRKLFFDRTPLYEVFDEITRFYDTPIIYSKTTNTTFSGQFENTSAEDVIKIVCLSSGLQYAKEKSAFKILEQNKK